MKLVGRYIKSTFRTEFFSPESAMIIDLSPCQHRQLVRSGQHIEEYDKNHLIMFDLSLPKSCSRLHSNVFFFSCDMENLLRYTISPDAYSGDRLNHHKAF